MATFPCSVNHRIVRATAGKGISVLRREARSRLLQGWSDKNRAEDEVLRKYQIPATVETIRRERAEW
eukprot:11415047-Prorocentrum_lima.AAC.1